jgi:hypothetical protein
MIFKKIIFFHSLENLNLNLNKLDNIRFPPSTLTNAKTALFPSLRQLHISENHISKVVQIFLKININQQK